MKKLYILYCLLFFVTCAVPGVMLLKQPEKSPAVTAEKRRLAEFPAFQDEEGHFNPDFSTEFQAYVSDHFGFRQELVQLDSRLKANLLHVSAEEDVIIGKKDWFYYAKTTDDFIGNPTISDLGLQNILHNLELMQKYTESMGSQLLVTIVPNKNTIYPEYMPDYYRNFGTPSNLDRLEQLLSDQEIPYLSLKDTLLQEKEQSELQLYHKLDSHWNNAGALSGYRAIMDATGLAYDSYPDTEKHYRIEWSRTGDVFEMLFPDSGVLDENVIYPDLAFTYRYLGHYKNSDDLIINTINPEGTGSLLMFRDSFGEAIIPYFSQNFQTATYSRARGWSFYSLESQQYDLVIAEIVERNIAWLQREAPMHSAIQVDPESVPASLASFVPLTECYTDQNGSFLQIYGSVTLPGDLTTAPEYYITLTDKDGEKISYKAYNCYESEKLGTETIQDNGYSLYIPVTDLQENTTYNVDLTVQLPDIVYKSALEEISCPQL
ncbi:MAG: hypothetical protein K2J71_10285 [Oscillospiraceae bacterium]|nr:hypothetical protein [Oscillospiraceae bacterium]